MLKYRAKTIKKELYLDKYTIVTKEVQIRLFWIWIPLYRYYISI